ncbi:MAG: ABC transporter permease subunit/CPBP intramembrane protease [Rubripirellula sp.]
MNSPSEPQPANTYKPSLYGRVLRLCQKELKETIRDRRTILTLLMMPLLVYPILSMALNRFLLASGSPQEGFTVCVQSKAEGDLLDAWLSDPRSGPPVEVLNASGGELASFRVTIVADQTPAEVVKSNEVDVGVSIEDVDSRTPKVTFFSFRGDAASQSARRVMVERLQWLRLANAEAVAFQSGRYAPPVAFKVETVGAAPKGSLLGTIVPLVLVLMTITGAVYPAIDLTAGERERGTMESVMASPVPRGYVLFSKYIAVVTVALLTAVANLTAMFTTLWAGGLMPMLTGGGAFPWIAILRIFGLLILFSGFYSALLLSLTSFAKSFKEAQAYLIPVMLISLAPAMLSLLPGASLSGPLAIVPLVNIVLLARDLLTGGVNPVGALAAVASTIGYAIAALSIASKLFGSDAVTRTSQQSIGSILQRPSVVSDVPTTQAATLMLALLVPIYFVTSNGLVRFLQGVKDDVSVETQLIFNAVALILTFGLVPLIAAFLGRNRFRSTYRFQMPGAVSLIGGVLIGLGAWVFAHEAFVLADAIGIGGLGEDKIRSAEQAVEKMRQASPFLLLAVFAITPAVIEELCFRGYLFSAFERVMSPWRTILVTSVLFGLFHVLTGSALLVERFIPSTLMGLVIGWVAYRTGSVIPGIVIHFVHNGLLNLVIYYHDQLEFLGTDFDNQAHLPALWIGGAAAIVVVGTGLVWLGSRGSLARHRVHQ